MLRTDAVSLESPEVSVVGGLKQAHLKALVLGLEVENEPGVRDWFLTKALQVASMDLHRFANSSARCHDCGMSWVMAADSISYIWWWTTKLRADAT